LVLEHLSRRDLPLSTYLQGEELWLRDSVSRLLLYDFIEIQGTTYQVTGKGLDCLANLQKRATRLIAELDIYSAVDLQSGEFAFSRYHELSKQAWELYIDQERFTDLRLAVAEYKQMDLHEVVYLTLFIQKRFDTATSGWEYYLATGDMWREMLCIVEHFISWKQIGDAPEMIIQEIIKRGKDVMVKITEVENSALI
jgi:hypothetical protein